jgi:hypothetical protein
MYLIDPRLDRITINLYEVPQTSDEEGSQFPSRRSGTKDATHIKT